MNRKYININGEYGFTHAGVDGWTTAEEIMREMDRLGIWQTVLEFVGGTNSMHRARRLLEDISTLPYPRERIIPCFSVEPGLLFQEGAVEELLEIMRQNQPCCISLRPKQGAYPMKAAEEILERISHLNPIVMIRFSEIRDRYKDGDDLVWLARRFPNMKFVVRRFIHIGWPFIYDVMRRAENIYMDISRLHTMQAIETACAHMGEDRVLFGQSSRGSGGASMGEIEYSEISEEVKDKIRCKNFIRLFSDPSHRAYLTANLRAIEDKVQNSFWRPFIEGKGVTGAELIDSHTHLGYTASYEYLPCVSFAGQIQRFEKEMERFNIKKIISTVTGIPHPLDCHRAVEAAVKGKVGPFLGYFRYNPNFEEVYTDEYLAERFATGYYVGLKSLPHYMETNINDKKYERMFQYAHDHHLPILIHTDDARGNPIDCAEMAARYPNCTMILGHTGCNDRGRAMSEEVAQNPKYKNVYFEFCASFLSSRTWVESLEVIDYKRVLYGTDAPGHSVVWELGRLLSEDIPDDKMRAILGGNAKELFGF